jgi:hypothetical protein
MRRMWPLCRLTQSPCSLAPLSSSHLTAFFPLARNFHLRPNHWVSSADVDADVGQQTALWCTHVIQSKMLPEHSSASPRVNGWWMHQSSGGPELRSCQWNLLILHNTGSSGPHRADRLFHLCVQRAIDTFTCVRNLLLTGTQATSHRCAVKNLAVAK